MHLDHAFGQVDPDANYLGSCNLVHGTSPLQFQIDDFDISILVPRHRRWKVGGPFVFDRHGDRMTTSRLDSIFQLHAITRVRRTVALDLIRDALSDAGVFITDIRHLSNKATVLQVMLRRERWNDMLDAISGTGTSLDPPHVRYPDSLKLDKDGDIFGTIQVMHISGEPDTKDVIPSVPG